MISLQQINFNVTGPETIYLSNGGIAGTIEPGHYIATPNLGQQPGWYSLYEADAKFSQCGPSAKVANVYLAFGPNGRVVLLA